MLRPQAAIASARHRRTAGDSADARARSGQAPVAPDPSPAVARPLIRAASTGPPPASAAPSASHCPRPFAGSERTH